MFSHFPFPLPPPGKPTTARTNDINNNNDHPTTNGKMLTSLLLPAAAAAVALGLLPTALSLEWPGPRETPTPLSLPDAQGWTPKPTDGPQFHVVAANPNSNLKLFRRQSISKYPNTCGYVDGNGEYSFTCSGAYACGYNTANFAFGCMLYLFTPSIPSLPSSHVVKFYRRAGGKKRGGGIESSPMLILISFPMQVAPAHPHQVMETSTLPVHATSILQRQAAMPRRKQISVQAPAPSMLLFGMSFPFLQKQKKSSSSTPF